jgi:hypothetical protein
VDSCWTRSVISTCVYLRHGGAAHNGVVHQQHLLPLEHGAHGVELAADRQLARALVRHDERAPHVAVLHQPLTVRFVEIVCHLDGRWAAAVGHRHHHVHFLV